MKCDRFAVASIVFLLGSLALFCAIPIKATLLMIAGVVWYGTARYLVKKTDEYC